MPRARRVSLRVLAVAFVVAAACGGASDAATLTVVGTEMAFEAPDRVPAGLYTITFRNAGAVHHELAVKDPNGVVTARRSIPPQQVVRLKVELEPGTWELGCFEPGHYEAGMRRALVVEAAA